MSLLLTVICCGYIVTPRARRVVQELTSETKNLASNGEIYQRIGKLIRMKRLAIKPKPLTQEELAHRVHLKRTSITNIEKGRQKLLVHTLFDIAAALDVPPADLIPTQKTHDGSVRELKGLKPDEREFARSVLSKKAE